MVMILCCHFNQYFLLCISVKPVVKVTPDQRVFRGETVTLTCDIQRAEHIQWTYSWFKDGSVIRDVTERVYSITSDESDSGEYSCEAQRSDPTAAVSLTVSGECSLGFPFGYVHIFSRIKITFIYYYFFKYMIMQCQTGNNYIQSENINVKCEYIEVNWNRVINQNI